MGIRSIGFTGLGGLFDNVKDFVMDLVYAYNVAFGLVLYRILSVLFLIIDIIQNLFRVLAGIGSYSIRGDSSVYEGDLVLSFITHDTIINIFFAMLAVAAILLITSTFIAVIKTEFEPLSGADKNATSKGKIIGSAMRAVVNMLTVPVVVFFGLGLASSLLATLDLASAPGRNELLSSRIFTIAAYDANRYRNDQEFRDLLNPPEGSGEESVGTYGIFEQGSGFGGSEDIANMIDYAFSNGIETPDGEGDTYSISPLVDTGPGVVITHNPLSITGFQAWELLEPNQFSIYNARTVAAYYNMGLLGGFSYLLAFVVAGIFIFNLAIVMIGLVKRLLMLTTLFAVAPPILAVYPLTQEPYKKWKENFISQTLSAFSIVVVMNIFTAFIPIIMSIQFFPSDDLVFILGAPLDMINRYTSILVLIATSFFFKEASSIIASMIGAKDAMSEGQAKAGQIGKAALGATLMGTGLGGIAGGKMLAMGSKANAGLKARNQTKNINNITKTPGMIEGKPTPKKRKKSLEEEMRDPDKASKDKIRNELYKNKDPKFAKMNEKEKKEYLHERVLEDKNSVAYKKKQEAEKQRESIINNQKQKEAERAEKIKQKKENKEAGIFKKGLNEVAGTTPLMGALKEFKSLKGEKRSKKDSSTGAQGGGKAASSSGQGGSDNKSKSIKELEGLTKGFDHQIDGLKNKYEKLENKDTSSLSVSQLKDWKQNKKELQNQIKEKTAKKKELNKNINEVNDFMAKNQLESLKDLEKYMGKLDRDNEKDEKEYEKAKEMKKMIRELRKK